MKTPIFALLVLSAAHLWGAEAVTKPAAAPIAGFAEAKAAALRGDAASAVQLLLAGNLTPLNSYDWQVESAQRLLLLAYAVPREGRADAVPQLITSALGYLGQAQALAPDTRGKAIANALAGNLHENFRGDHAQALASYRLAAQLMPEHPTAQRSAERLQRLLNNLRARQSR